MIDITRKLKLLKHLDERSAALLEKIEASLSKSDKGDSRPAILKSIKDDQQSCLEIAQEKISTAQQTYDLLDLHIRRLDQDLKKFEEERKLGKDKANKGKKQTGDKRKSTDAGLNEIDMEYDDTEPKYCFCNQVSFGNMVACENPDCKIEWFHFDCVGLTEQPKGMWYCPDCRQTMKKQQRR
mmetsp:Transcript_42492/g.109253  ORF Transcript_42492/g.109253 Transcript_42492/m.109253 type:complete len:182 (-) Transcript_42492:157-702(-)